MFIWHGLLRFHTVLCPGSALQNSPRVTYKDMLRAFGESKLHVDFGVKRRGVAQGEGKIRKSTNTLCIIRLYVYIQALIIDQWVPMGNDARSNTVRNSRQQSMLRNM